MPRLRVFIAATLLIAAVVAAGGSYWLWSRDVISDLTLGTGTEGGTYSAFGRVVEEAFAGEDAGLSIVPVASAGARENAARVQAGEIDLGLIQSDTSGGNNVSLVARLFPEIFHLIVRDGSGIESVGDLEGRRVAVMPEGSGSNVLFADLLEHYLVAPDAVDQVPGSLLEGTERLADGDVDALFVVIALGNKTIEQLIRSSPVRLVGVDQAEALALFDPALRATVVPVGTYSGEGPVPAEAINVVAVDSLLVAGRSVPAETIETFTRTLFESRQEMVRSLDQVAFISPPTETDRLAFGVHPGAEAYYSKDDPLFVVEYAEPMAFALSFLALLLSLLWQARIWLANARKNRADHHNLEIAALVDRIEAATTSDELEELRRELFAIFQKVIVDLDTDRIEEKSLTSFSFAWQVASSTLNHRQLLLSDRRPDPS
ncbi:TAXI family TRAP transporter solute-binding subunit [Amorphus orientalis]|uniref:TRAP transporter TAXI family solute receptor n=1 Tax=Amorphus orientalis TaxID=649198 RepID=A0AAE3VT03_9HYPH|nr:TAXI family TRAP transporter solute-binding subunit [Amorphus orientalis]MDQ0317046.1 TRAP transporter TAXI family solute receptor [Amorphus orientalis]